jgi:hypothetical protein
MSFLESLLFWWLFWQLFLCLFSPATLARVSVRSVACFGVNSGDYVQRPIWYRVSH